MHKKIKNELADVNVFSDKTRNQYARHITNFIEYLRVKYDK